MYGGSSSQGTAEVGKENLSDTDEPSLESRVADNVMVITLLNNLLVHIMRLNADVNGGERQAHCLPECCIISKLLRRHGRSSWWNGKTTQLQLDGILVAGVCCGRLESC